MKQAIFDYLCSLVVNGYTVPIMVVLALIIMLLAMVLWEDYKKTKKIEIELEKERVDMKDLILRMKVGEIVEKYSEGKETIKELIERYKKCVEETTIGAAHTFNPSDFELFVSGVQFRLDVIGMLFMMRKLKEHKEDTKELIELLKELVEDFEKDLSRIIGE